MCPCLGGVGAARCRRGRGCRPFPILGRRGKGTGGGGAGKGKGEGKGTVTGKRKGKGEGNEKREGKEGKGALFVGCVRFRGQGVEGRRELEISPYVPLGVPHILIGLGLTVCLDSRESGGEG